jgi:hypothetical protein
MALHYEDDLAAYEKSAAPAWRESSYCTFSNTTATFTGQAYGGPSSQRRVGRRAIEVWASTRLGADHRDLERRGARLARGRRLRCREASYVTGLALPIDGGLVL